MAAKVQGLIRKTMPFSRRGSPWLSLKTLRKVSKEKREGTGNVSQTENKTKQANKRKPELKCSRAKFGSF